MNKKIFINLKTNKNSVELLNYLTEINNLKNFKCVLFVNFMYLLLAKKYSNNNIQIGSQSGFWIDSGNYTSQVSLKQINDEGIKWVLLGHCEDVKYNHLTLEQLKLQLEKSIDLNYNIVFCFGELNKIDNFGDRINYLINYLEQINIYKYLNNNFYLAYEPVYLIGGKGQININEIRDIVINIKKYFMNKYNLNINLIYGGSVNNTNIDSLNNINELDGFLIGSYAWSIDNLKFIK